MRRRASSKPPWAHGRRRRPGLTGACAGSARGDMAAGIQLSQRIPTLYAGAEDVARYVSEVTDGRFSIVIAAGEDAVPTGQVLGRQGRRGRMRPHGLDPLFRYRPGAQLRRRRAVRPEHAPDARLDDAGRGPGAHARAVWQAQHPELSLRLHRRADGRLVSRRDQDRR